jgi:hypothetical protein
MDDIYWRDEKVEVPGIDWSPLGPAMEPGIYFGLDEQTYRAAGAVSASLIKDVTVSPLTGWAENIDPSKNYKADDTEAQDEGTALHKRILEGEEAFRERCAVLPENDGSYLEGIAELKARCKELGLKMGGNTSELCARILEADPDAKLWPMELYAFHSQHAGKIHLKPDVWQRLELRARLIGLHPEVKNAFKGGYSEVSIFWTDERGMPCKARADYLKIIGAVDLKYFANKGKLPIDQAVNRAIVDHRIQARHYCDAVKAARTLAREGKVFGDVPDSEWIEAFAAHPEHRFFWVFVQKGPVPEVDCVEFVRGSDGATENLYWTNASGKIAAAKQIIRLSVETYGNEPWIWERKARVLKDDNQPLWSLD